MVGHATHFLERLKRANDAQAERAMRLYHRPHMVRIVLEMMKLPKEVDRLAISISPKDNGPYIVVSRGGTFITCLGEAMKTGDLYVVSFERFDSYIKRFDELRDRGKYIEEALNNLGPVEHFESLLNRSGWRFCREDFLAYSSLHPAMQLTAFTDLHTIVRAIERAERGLLLNKKLPKANRPLEVHWNFTFAVGHNLAYSTMFGPKGLEPYLELPEIPWLFQESFRLGQMSTASRGLFATAKIGRYGIPICEQFIEKGSEFTFWLYGILGLLAIGTRHRRLRVQTHRIIKRAIETNKQRSYIVQKYQQKLGDHFPGLLNLLMNEPEGAHEYATKAFRQMFFSRDMQPTDPSAPYYFETQDQVPEGLAYAYGLNMLVDLRIEPVGWSLLAASIPWLAEADAEDLYRPRALDLQETTKWDRGGTEYLINNFRAIYLPKGSATAPDRPKRNAPCHCGSGKKYKKCCKPKDDEKDIVCRTRLAHEATAS